jgi:hypothetical protein
MKLVEVYTNYPDIYVNNKKNIPIIIKKIKSYQSKTDNNANHSPHILTVTQKHPPPNRSKNETIERDLHF